MARVRALMTSGQQPEIVKAVEDGKVFIDTLGKRWSSEDVISYHPVVDQEGNPL